MRLTGGDLAAPEQGAGRAYVTTVYWYAHPRGASERSRDLSAWHPDPEVSDHPTLDAAERHGRQWGCLAGVRRVEVHAPDGTLQALWDKESQVYTKRRRFVVDGRMRYDIERKASRWQSVGVESQDLRRSRYAAALDDLAARRQPTREASVPPQP